MSVRAILISRAFVRQPPPLPLPLYLLDFLFDDRSRDGSLGLWGGHYRYLLLLLAPRRSCFGLCELENTPLSMIPSLAPAILYRCNREKLIIFYDATYTFFEKKKVPFRKIFKPRCNNEQSFFRATRDPKILSFRSGDFTIIITDCSNEEAACNLFVRHGIHKSRRTREQKAHEYESERHDRPAVEKK